MNDSVQIEIKEKIQAIKDLTNSCLSQQYFQAVINDGAKSFYHEVRRELALHMHEYPFPEIIQTLIRDKIPSVRIAIIQNSSQIRSEMGNDFIINLMKELITDPIPNVRIALANSIHDHIFLTSESTSSLNPGQSDENALELFVRTKIDDLFLFNGLLLDQSDDVRIAAARNYRYFVNTLGFDFVFVRLLNSLQIIFIDTQYRVRIIGAELVFALGIFSPSDFFDEFLFPFYLRFLTDSCQKVREFSVSALPSFIEHFCSNSKNNIQWKAKQVDNTQKDENLFAEQIEKMFQSRLQKDEEVNMKWLMKSLVVKLEKALLADNNYINQQTYLMCLREIAPYVPTQFVRKTIFLPMIHFLKDPSISDSVIILTLDILYELRESIHPFQREKELKPVLQGFVNSLATPSIKTRAAKILAFFD